MFALLSLDILCIYTCMCGACVYRYYYYFSTALSAVATVLPVYCIVFLNVHIRHQRNFPESCTQPVSPIVFPVQPSPSYSVFATLNQRLDGQILIFLYPAPSYTLRFSFLIILNNFFVSKTTIFIYRVFYAPVVSLWYLNFFLSENICCIILFVRSRISHHTNFRD